MSDIKEGLCGLFSPCEEMKAAIQADAAADPNEPKEQLARQTAILLIAVGTGVCPCCHRKVRADA
jgi:hypothetical protein